LILQFDTGLLKMFLRRIEFFFALHPCHGTIFKCRWLTNIFKWNALTFALLSFLPLLWLNIPRRLCFSFIGGLPERLRLRGEGAIVRFFEETTLSLLSLWFSSMGCLLERLRF